MGYLIGVLSGQGIEQQQLQNLMVLKKLQPILQKAFAQTATVTLMNDRFVFFHLLHHNKADQHPSNYDRGLRDILKSNMFLAIKARPF